MLMSVKTGSKAQISYASNATNVHPKTWLRAATYGFIDCLDAECNVTLLGDIC